MRETGSSLDRRDLAWWVDRGVQVLVFLGGVSGIVFVGPPKRSWRSINTRPPDTYWTNYRKSHGIPKSKRFAGEPASLCG